MRFFTTRERFFKYGHLEKAKRSIKIINEIFEFSNSSGIELNPLASMILHAIRDLAEVAKTGNDLMTVQAKILSHQTFNTMFDVLEMGQREIMTITAIRQRSA